MFDTPIPPPSDALRRQVAQALDEDIGPGDINALLTPAERVAAARIVCRQRAVICGRPWADAAFRQLDAGVHLHWLVADGDETQAGDTVLELRGNARALLGAERCALNFLQTLSATATLVRELAKLIEDLPVTLLDTRKTIPGLRLAQKYAVRCGGGVNHRFGLHDGFLIKENHIAAAGSIAVAVAAARALQKNLPIEVEVENLDQLRECIAAGADIALLDNFDLASMTAAAASFRDDILLEASGGIGRDDIRAVAATGVHRVSVGALTKNVDAVDMSMLFD